MEAQEGEVPALLEWSRNPSADPAAFEERVVATLPTVGVGAITGRRVTMLQFTETLQRLLGTSVLDQTMLHGKYYFAFRYATEEATDSGLPNLSGAIRELGLRLERHKVRSRCWWWIASRRFPQRTDRC
jgi:uncharacterized protein (TIGR03435 family)